MRTRILLLCCMALYFTSCLQQDNDFDYSENIGKDDWVISDVPMQPGAYESYMNLMDVICNQTRSSVGNPIYPEYYGGTYVDDEGNLVVLITEDAATTRDASEAQMLLSCDNIVFMPCKHSYNRLKQLVDSISMLIDENVVWSNNIGMYGIDDVNNNVSVYLYDDSRTKREEFLKDFSDELVGIGWCGSIEEHAAIPCGFALYSKSRGSVGYRAKDSEGKIGIVSAGHCFSEGDTIYYSPNQLAGEAEIIGKCKSSARDDGFIDACFCEITEPIYLPSNILPVRMWGITSGQQPSDSILYGTLSTELAQPPVGLTVNTIGSTSGWRYGEVVKHSFICKTNYGFLRDVIYADYKSDSGDSGGIVYAYQSSSGGRLTVGINKGWAPIVNPDGDPDTVSICIKAYLINQRLGLTRY